NDVATFEFTEVRLSNFREAIVAWRDVATLSAYARPASSLSDRMTHAPDAQWLLPPKNVLFELGAAGLQTDTRIDTVRRPTARMCRGELGH
ncbi:MAG: hypothetical protein CMJ75_06640, partial [Planctomycetaceae bacterium]|nr:hypothetical protein [Planctomycetaceae bacterium]